MSDPKLFKLPDVGEGLTEAEIVTWNVAVGDTVKVNEVIVEIETAKSLVELPCPYAGTVVELYAAEGDTVNVGMPIIAVDTGEGGQAAPQTPEVGNVAEDLVPTPKDDEPVEPGLIGGPAPGGRTSVLVGYGPRTTEAKRRPRKSGSTPVEQSPTAAQIGVQHAFTPHSTPAPEVDIEAAEPADIPDHALAHAGTNDAASTSGVRALAKPPVRKLAKDLGVDLAAVTPTGPHKTISRDDVQSFAGGGPETVAQPTTAASAARRQTTRERETRIPVKGVRKMTAQAMVSSAFTAPHVTEWITIDATRTMKMVARLRAHREFRDVKVSPLLVVARAVCVAARRTPEVNASWDEATQEIVLKSYVNLGIAAATPRGLMVPNIKDADTLNAVELAQSLGGLTRTARDGKTQPADMSGGTFTITNVGIFGVDAGTPILNPGESGILCMGAIRKQPWMMGKKIKPRWITTLALSFDHRVVDGEQGSKFLADVAAIVEDPGNALLF